MITASTADDYIRQLERLINNHNSSSVLDKSTLQSMFEVYRTYPAESKTPNNVLAIKYATELNKYNAAKGYEMLLYSRYYILALAGAAEQRNIKDPNIQTMIVNSSGALGGLSAFINKAYYVRMERWYDGLDMRAFTAVPQTLSEFKEIYRDQRSHAIALGLPVPEIERKIYGRKSWFTSD